MLPSWMVTCLSRLGKLRHVRLLVFEQDVCTIPTSCFSVLSFHALRTGKARVVQLAVYPFIKLGRLEQVESSKVGVFPKDITQWSGCVLN